MTEIGFYYVILSALISAGRALIIVNFLMVFSFVVAALIEMKAGIRMSTILNALADGIESIPVFMWVLVAASVMPSSSYVVTVIFMIAALPFSLNALRSMIREIINKPYCEAAIALGTSNFHILMRHILPNMILHLMPIYIYLVGNCIAVYGAVGVFGMINRSSNDLGILLLVGREKAAFDASLLLVVILTYLLIFAFLFVIARRFSKVWQIGQGAAPSHSSRTPG
jgi:ABC-type dipeptide/oligopeptide/nickel transport system permease subunit